MGFLDRFPRIQRPPYRQPEPYDPMEFGRWYAKTRIELSKERREDAVKRRAILLQKNLKWDEEKAMRVADYLIEPWSGKWIR